MIKLLSFGSATVELTSAVIALTHQQTFASSWLPAMTFTSIFMSLWAIGKALDLFTLQELPEVLTIEGLPRRAPGGDLA